MDDGTTESRPEREGVKILDRDLEAARAIADAIHAVYMVGIRVGVEPAVVAQLMIVDAVEQMLVSGHYAELAGSVKEAMERSKRRK